MNKRTLIRVTSACGILLFIGIFSAVFAGCGHPRPGEQETADDQANSDYAGGDVYQGAQGAVEKQALNDDGTEDDEDSCKSPDCEIVGQDIDPPDGVNDSGTNEERLPEPPDPDAQIAHATAVAPRCYFTNFNGNAVDVLDSGTRKFIAHIPVGQKPRGIAITPDGRTLYVANSASASISILDTGALQATAAITLPAGSSPYGIAFSEDGTTAYVANFITAGSVFVIDVASKSLKATIPVGDHPIRVAASPDGTRIFVTNFNSNSMMAIDTLTNTVAATVPLPNPDAITTSLDGRSIYVTTNVQANQGTLTILDGVTYAISQTVPVGVLPVALQVSTDGRFLFVACAGSNFVPQFSTKTNTLIRNLPSIQGIQALTFVQH